MLALAGAPSILAGRQPCLLQRPSRSLARRRRCVVVQAFWPGFNSKSDGETDDEIFTAAAISNRGQGRRGQRQEAQHAAPTAAADDAPPTRQSLFQFATALAFVTVGAFFIGSYIRKYILQPGGYSDSLDSGSSIGGAAGGVGGSALASVDGGAGGRGGRAKRRASKAQRGGSAPSVEDLLRQHGTVTAVPAVPFSEVSSGDSVLSSAAVVASREQAEAAAEAAAVAAAASAAAQAAAQAAAEEAQCAAGAAAGEGVPAAAAANGAREAAPAPAPAPAAPAASAGPAEVPPDPGAAAPAAAGSSMPAKTTAVALPEAAPSAAAPLAQLGQQPQQREQPQQQESQQQQADEEWCSTILEPAIVAAEAKAAAKAAAAKAEAEAAKAAEQQQLEEAAAAAVSAAAAAAAAMEQQSAAAPAVGSMVRPELSLELEAAAPLLDCQQLWVVCQQTAQGPKALRLLFPVPGAGEQKCVAFFQDETDALAAQSALQRVLCLPTTLQQLPAAILLADAARRQRCAAFYARSSLRAALTAVEDAALQQELLDGMRRMAKGMDVPAEALEAVAALEGSSLGGEDEDEHRPDVSELLLAVLQQQAVLLNAGQLGEVAACMAPQAATVAGGASSSSVSSAGPAAASPEVQQQNVASAATGRAMQQAQQQAAAAAGAAAAAASWDPTAEKLPKRRADPSWWLTLTIVHVPQLLYADGAKGLMSVPVSLPGMLQQGSGGSGGAAGSSGSSGAATERRLVAFADMKDAEALADCSMQAGSGATDIQVISVPPATLRAHAEANGCGVAALPPGALRLPAGASYDVAVSAVVEAVEAQFYEQLLAEAGRI